MAVQPPPSFPAVARGGGRKNTSSKTPKTNAAHMTSRPIRTIAISPGVRWDRLQFCEGNDASNAKGITPTVLIRQDADTRFEKTGGLVDRDMDLKNETLGHAGHDGPRKTGNRDAVAVALRTEKLQGCVSLIPKQKCGEICLPGSDFPKRYDPGLDDDLLFEKQKNTGGPDCPCSDDKNPEAWPHGLPPLR
jgi:hypothetical protein